MKNKFHLICYGILCFHVKSEGTISGSHGDQ